MESHKWNLRFIYFIIIRIDYTFKFSYLLVMRRQVNNHNRWTDRWTTKRLCFDYDWRRIWRKITRVHLRSSINTLTPLLRKCHFVFCVSGVFMSINFPATRSVSPHAVLFICLFLQLVFSLVWEQRIKGRVF